MFVAAACLTGIHARAYTLKGEIRDKFNDTPLFGAMARIYDAEADTLVAEREALSVIYINNERNEFPCFTFRNLNRDRHYRLQLTKENFDTVSMTVNPSDVPRRTDEYNIGIVHMSRRARDLQEITVKATKVKFYLKGDTIVYNADAFNLAEGSMLDALIRQLPGAEIKTNGQIYVNGRFVENLLLNGKDFFKGNNQIMLDNLGSYAVKNIYLYERQEEMDEIMGKDYGNKHYTMDVRLKREYAQGMVLNAEAGYGTNERWLGRLFALWYGEHARVGAFGNANNVNDSRKPGQETSFTPSDMNSGEQKNYQGGIDYSADIPWSGVSFNGNVTYAALRNNDVRSVIRTNFLATGDTYGYSFSGSNSKNWKLSTYHSMMIRKQKWNMEVKPEFYYDDTDILSSLAAATFSRKWNEMDAALIHDLYSGLFAEQASSTLNRNLQENVNKGHKLKGSLFSNGKILIGKEGDALTYLVSGNYTRPKYDAFERFSINYGDNPESAQRADRYFQNHPDNSYELRGAVGYIHTFSPSLLLDAYYEYDHNTIRESSSLFRLERIHDQTTEDPFGYLPSVREYEGTLDPSNSYDSHAATDLHTANFNFTYKYSPARLNVRLSLPLAYRHNFLHYVRGDVDARLKRNRFYLGNAEAEINWSPRIGWIYAYFKRTVNAPDLVYSVDMRNDLNPLEITVGNPDLKDSESYEGRVYLSRMGNGVEKFCGIEFDAHRNALSMAAEYDTSTGVRTSSMHNVNGNWGGSMLESGTLPFGKDRMFSFSERVKLAYRRSVDFMGYDGGPLQRNVVNNYRVAISPSLRWRPYDGSEITLFGDVNGSWFRSRLDNFMNFNAWDISYGLRANLRLPANFSLSTDFTVYTRRGYSDPALNDDNYVWNARLTYSILKGQLLLMIDGFDILNSLSNVSYSVNAQGRTETFSNVLPRYAMFHIQWKFNRMPKKRAE